VGYRYLYGVQIAKEKHIPEVDLPKVKKDKLFIGRILLQLTYAKWVLTDMHAQRSHGLSFL